MNHQTTKASNVSGPQANHQPVPWWQVKMMWLVIAGPLIVVVAALTTAVVAIRGQDPVLVTGPEDLQVDPSKKSNPSYRPAIEGRNHSATGGIK